MHTRTEIRGFAVLLLLCCTWCVPGQLTGGSEGEDGHDTRFSGVDAGDAGLITDAGSVPPDFVPADASGDGPVKGLDSVRTATLSGAKVMVFNGIPPKNGWGEDLVYQAKTSQKHTMLETPLGGVPLVDIWTEKGGVALFNVSKQHEPFTVTITVKPGAVTINANGGSNVYRYQHDGDYFEALRQYAVLLKQQTGVAVRKAPDWAFDPIWETYGFEESWSPNIVKSMVPLLKQLGVRTITFDSGWYGAGAGGEGSGGDWDAREGFFPINPDVVGTEQDLIDLIAHLHQPVHFGNRGFKVRLWWCPGEVSDDFLKQHPGWKYSPVSTSWCTPKDDPNDCTNFYVDPTRSDVRKWNRGLVQRFVGKYGADGFKLDDVYEIADKSGGYSAAAHQGYSQLFNDIYTEGKKLKPDFAVNTCNCGIVQNIHHFSGQNQLITSDPVTPRQIRLRGKYLQALNIGGAAILGDHVELTQGDVGTPDLAKSSFYGKITDSDFASIVALGMVLQTKFTKDPGPVYKRWFGIYPTYRFYRMQWLNVPYLAWRDVETYLLRASNGDLHFSFFARGGRAAKFSGSLQLTNLVPGVQYDVLDVAQDKPIPGFKASSAAHSYAVSFTGSLVIRLRKKTP